MCGICGIVHGDRSRNVEHSILEGMNQTLKHRGPDDHGIYIKENAGLASRRLSIIDLETGQQPVHNEAKTIWVVLNGEIYNYRELTRMLEHRGHRFYTSSDTEVIIHAYEEFGVEFVQHLNGMFAFALWDENEQRMIAARDRLGIKPLFYANLNDALIFGSEIKALLNYPDFERTIDLVALDEYLTFEYIPTPRTIFKGIHQLPPGHLLFFRDNKIQLEQYWDVNLQRSENIQPKSVSDYEHELLDILRESVRKEMVSDVPIGVLLSGGIDSSSVAALMQEVSSGHVKSFSIAFDDPSFDEATYARQVARHLETDHMELTLTPKIMLELMSNLPDYLDQPLGDSSIIPTYLLSQFTRQHVKVALGGDGGDELFAGYSTLQSHRLVEYYEKWIPQFARHKMIPWVVDRLPVSYDNISLDFKARRFISGRGVPAIVRHHLWLGSYSDGQKNQLLQPWVRVREKDTFDTAFQHWENSRAEQAINRILYCDMKLYLEGDILSKVDRASMANSLEVRVPLLNHTLVEYVTGIPLDVKLRGFKTKDIFRRSMKKYLPNSILDRGKKGFNMPVAKWLNSALSPMADDLFSEDRLRGQGYFNPGYVNRLLSDHRTMKQDNRKLLWTLLVFQLWYDRWISS